MHAQFWRRRAGVQQGHVAGFRFFVDNTRTMSFALGGTESVRL